MCRIFVALLSCALLGALTAAEPQTAPDNKENNESVSAAHAQQSVASAKPRHHSSATPAGQNKASTPNIILVLADDAGYGDFGCYGGQHLPTPHVDRMAAEGIRFTRHYAGSTVCAPSRCVLLTGRHTGHCSVRGNSPGLLAHDEITLPEILKSAGYRTACIGKWGVGAPPPLTDPNDHGFDLFFGYVSMWHAHNFYPEFLIRNGQRHPLKNRCQPRWHRMDGRGIAIERREYAPLLLRQQVLAEIRNASQSDQPFFLYYALNIPHANNEAGRFSDRPEKGMEVPDFGPYADKTWPAPEKGFAAMIHHIDTDIGLILELLRETGIDDRTLVLFSSDNGPHQEGGHDMEFFDSNGPLRGMKRDLYEGGIRVPLIARWPNRIKAGRVSRHVCGFQDFLPTLSKIAGATVPDGIDGISFEPELTGAGVQAKHDFLYWEFSEQKGKRAVLKDNWKLIQLNAATPNPAAPELYNLKTDPSEEHNIAAQHPQLVKELTALLDAAHQHNSAYPLFADERAKAAR